MTDIDLTTLSTEQLQELSRTAKELARKKADDTVADATRRINEIAEGAGLTVRVFVPGKRRRHVLAVKYRDPSNPDNVWRGRSAKPKWLVAKLAEGHTLEEFLV